MGRVFLFLSVILFRLFYMYPQKVVDRFSMPQVCLHSRHQCFLYCFLLSEVTVTERTFIIIVTVLCVFVLCLFVDKFVFIARKYGDHNLHHVVVKMKSLQLVAIYPVSPKSCYCTSCLSICLSVSISVFMSFCLSVGLSHYLSESTRVY